MKFRFRFEISRRGPVCLCYRPTNFEIDWLYLGCDVIMPIEIGLYQNSPEYCIINKIEQCVVRIIPHFELMIYSLCREFFSRQNMPENEKKLLIESNFTQFVSKNFAIMVVLPLVSQSQFQACLDKLSEEEKPAKPKGKRKLGNDSSLNIKKILIENFEQLKFVYFSLKEDSTNDPFQLYQLQRNGSDKIICLLRSGMNVHNFFRSAKASENPIVFNYASAILALSRLKVVDNVFQENKGEAIDIDEKYADSMENWVKKRNFELVNLNYILSPQQHSILGETNNNRLVIFGETGSGKTALLLAKCQKIAELDEVKKILFVFDERKDLFRDWLTNFIEINGTENLRAKITLIGDFKLVI